VPSASKDMMPTKFDSASFVLSIRGCPGSKSAAGNSPMVAIPLDRMNSIRSFWTTFEIVEWMVEMTGQQQHVFPASRRVLPARARGNCPTISVEPIAMPRSAARRRRISQRIGSAKDGNVNLTRECA